VHVAFDTIEWECGVDLDPEFVYAKCTSPVSALSVVWPTLTYGLDCLIFISRLTLDSGKYFFRGNAAQLTAVNCV